MPFRPIEPPNSSTASSVSPRVRTRSPGVEAPAPLSATASTSCGKRPHHKADRSGPNWDEDGDYLVGKNRPPKKSQWVKGQSGNPKGPVKREPLSLQAKFEQTVLAPFTATVNGEAVPLTMDMFAIQMLKSSAAKGSVKAAQILLEFYVSQICKVAERESGPEVESWEQAVIDRLLTEFNLPQRPVIRQTDRRG